FFFEEDFFAVVFLVDFLAGAFFEEDFFAVDFVPDEELFCPRGAWDPAAVFFSALGALPFDPDPLVLSPRAVLALSTDFARAARRSTTSPDSSSSSAAVSTSPPSSLALTSASTAS